MLRRSFWTEGPGSFALAIGLALVIRWAFLEAYVIPSSSMIPTLLINDHIFVNKIAFGLRVPFSERWLVSWSEPQRGDVIVFRYPGNKELFYVKRVIGAPGDQILYENGNLYLNNQSVERTIPQALANDWRWVRDEDFPGEQAAGGKGLYVHWQEILGTKAYSIALRKDTGSSGRVNFGPVTVPDGHYFVLGDNRDNSEDSRAWKSDAEVAGGLVNFWRDSVDGEMVIPKGTKISSSSGHVSFVTEEDVILKGMSVDVSIRAQQSGAIGNVAAGQLTILEDQELAKRVNVTNPSATWGGVDKRFVPRESILGRASFVLLSCEETLPVVTFLCNPLTIRWTRFFHSIK